MDRKRFWIGYFVGVALAVAAILFRAELMEAEDIPTPAVVEQLSLRDSEGKEFKLASLSNKAKVINFWATWCKPCVKELPHFQKAKEKYGEDVVFIMISDEPLEKIEAFKAKNNYSFLFLRSDAALADHGIYSIPLSYFYKANGEYISAVSGGMDEEEILSKVEEVAQ